MNGIIERVRKLLAKARDRGVTEEEALAFASKARALMIEYEISAEAVDDTHREKEYVLEAVPVKDFAVWKAVLRRSAAELYFCEFMLEVENPALSERFLLFGAGKHLEAAKSFGEYLEGAVWRKLQQAAMKGGPKAPEFNESFLNQAAFVLAQRVKALAKGEKAPAMPGSTLPVPVALESQMQAALKAEFGGDMENVQTRAHVKDALGLALGAKAGRDVPLNQQIAGGRDDALRLGKGDC